jgi:hypothetical protein
VHRDTPRTRWRGRRLRPPSTPRQLSAVARGRAYEAVVCARLTALGARLGATGGAFDQGVDLAGTWALPFAAGAARGGDRVALACVLAPPRALPVAVQCKATRGAFGVGAMREFQHAVAARWPAGGALAVVACSGGFARRALAREREWARAVTLLLTVSAAGALEDAAVIAPAGAAGEPAFIVARVAAAAAGAAAGEGGG